MVIMDPEIMVSLMIVKKIYENLASSSFQFFVDSILKIKLLQKYLIEQFQNTF